jgi:hypothetical protein
MKKCSSCKSELDLSEFFKHSQTFDGHHSWCKKCCKEGNNKSRAKLNSTIEGKASIFLLNARKSAIKRGNEFELEISDIVDMWNEQLNVCPYSGIVMTLESGKFNTVSVERIDSKIGYTKDNTILVCSAINRMKSDFEFNQFYDLCKSVTIFLSDNDLNIQVGAYK